MRLPANAIYDVAPAESGERILLLMLPGAKNTPQQLVENGFIRELRERNLAVDVLALDAHVDLYLDRAQVERLLHDTLDEARTYGYRRIWLLGISLGGTGAMLCATQRTTEIEGMVLLAPFLGTRGIIAEIGTAGGLRRWQAGEIDSRDLERALLERIQQSQIHTQEFPPIYLGYGSEDRYRGASILLSEHLPQHRVSVMVGGHDWETWIGLWRGLLDRKPFAG
jgi:alpha-beta hydrolase superfamily lysophospholipase